MPVFGIGNVVKSTVSRNVLFYFPQSKFIPFLRIYLVLFCLKHSSIRTSCVQTGLDLARLCGCADLPHPRVATLMIMASFVLSGSIPNLISDGT